MSNLLRRRAMMGVRKPEDKGWKSGVRYDWVGGLAINTYINQNNGRVIAYKNWSSTDFLPCHGVGRFEVKGMREYNAFYDKNKNYIAGFNLLNKVGYINNPHPEAFFVRFSSYTQELNDSQRYVIPYD